MKHKKALTLSLVIPVFNEEHQITSCLNAIKNQSVMPNEVIVVDNNSSDNTIKIAKKYNFVTVVHEPKQGIVYARNRGFNKAKSDIIGRIDADTIIDPEWTNNVIDFFVKNKKASAISGSTTIREWRGKLLLYWGHRIIYYWISWLFLGHRTLFGSSMAIKNSAWNLVNQQVCLRNDIHEDMDLSIHLKNNGLKIYFSNKLHASISPRRIMHMWHYPKMWVKTKLVHYFFKPDKK